MAAQSSAMFGWSWIEVSVLGSQVFGQALTESCANDLWAASSQRQSYSSAPLGQVTQGHVKYTNIGSLTLSFLSYNDDRDLTFSSTFRMDNMSSCCERDLGFKV